jgi:hypothetical protein
MQKYNWEKKSGQHTEFLFYKFSFKTGHVLNVWHASHWLCAYPSRKGSLTVKTISCYTVDFVEAFTCQKNLVLQNMIKIVKRLLLTATLPPLFLFFLSHFHLFPGIMFCREITLLLYFPAKFSREFTLSLYFLANDR